MSRRLAGIYAAGSTGLAVVAIAIAGALFGLFTPADAASTGGEAAVAIATTIPVDVAPAYQSALGDLDSMRKAALNDVAAQVAAQRAALQEQALREVEAQRAALQAQALSDIEAQRAAAQQALAADVAAGRAQAQAAQTAAVPVAAPPVAVSPAVSTAPPPPAASSATAPVSSQTTRTGRPARSAESRSHDD